MDRRLFLTRVLGMATLVVASGHTPYKQWSVYRKRHLLILTIRGDKRAYDLAKAAARVLAAYLPASDARVTRARDLGRVASLIGSKQLDVVVLSRQQAVALWRGGPPASDYEPIALRTLVDFGDYLLLCRDDFPARHAYLMAKTLTLHGEKPGAPPPVAKPGDDASWADLVPLHPGARAYSQNRRLPPAPGRATE